MLASATEVMITGAGPAGLMMACQLLSNHIRFRIIDKNLKTTDYSGALVIHAGTLEIFRQLGIEDDFLKHGRILKAINFSVNGQLKWRIDTSNYGSHLSEYPFVLLLEQSKTEALLSGYLENHRRHVERGVELKDFTEFSDHIENIVLDSNGKEETVISDYLIAADGGQSFVREKLEIPLIGKTHARSLFATDCEADLNLPDNEALIAISRNATTGFFPLGDHLWRIDGAFRWHMGNGEIDFNTIDGSFSGITKVKTNIHNPRWFSTFHSHKRNAAYFNTNRCFLVGDAAHLYSPVGAQGMNHAIHDACNLAWKMSFIIKKLAKPCILETYESERKQIAAKTSYVSDLLFSFLSTDRVLPKFGRISVLPFIIMIFKPVLRKPAIRQFLFRKISGVGVAYGKNILNSKSERKRIKGPESGERLPYFILNYEGKTVNIKDFISGSSFALLIFVVDKCPEFDAILEKFRKQVTITYLTRQAGTVELFRQFVIKRTTYYLVRPDFYIASTGHTCEYLEKYLSGVLIPVNR
jgi:2-polyprenyl-6-methoxyphenol hydroxylase-like FAD-dependent oxidoreductase